MYPIVSCFQTNCCHLQAHERELMRMAKLWSVRVQSGSGDKKTKKTKKQGRREQGDVEAEMGDRI